MNITYKIKEGEEGIIVKCGHEVEFKMSEVRPHMEKLQKAKEKHAAQIELEVAKQRNVEDNHPVIGGLTDEEMTAAAIYHESKGTQKTSEDQIKAIDELLESYEKELKEIEAQTGLTV